jgi:hypothetical protein
MSEETLAFARGYAVLADHLDKVAMFEEPELTPEERVRQFIETCRAWRDQFFTLKDASEKEIARLKLEVSTLRNLAALAAERDPKTAESWNEYRRRFCNV